MLTRRAIFNALAVTAFTSSVTSIPAFAQDPAGERLALKGYDPVAYFTIGEPIEGLGRFEYVWDGMRYRFASGAHREMFKANPEKYAPQFGGSCAMSMSAGVRREADPHNWTISNGNLYVFAGTGGVERFRQSAESAPRASINWKSLKSTPTQ